MCLARLSIILLCSLWTALGVYAQGVDEADSSIKQRMSELLEKKQQEGSGNGSLPKLQLPFAPAHLQLSEENRAVQQAAAKAYFQHIIESNEHQLRVFRWQLLSAKIIFCVVILLVAAGIYFAAVQFHKGLRSGKPMDQETELEASLKGIKVSSPVLGVVILSLSLLFFYLYLVHVYPIEFVGG